MRKRAAASAISKREAKKKPCVTPSGASGALQVVDDLWRDKVIPFIRGNRDLESLACVSKQLHRLAEPFLAPLRALRQLHSDAEKYQEFYDYKVGFVIVYPNGAEIPMFWWQLFGLRYQIESGRPFEGEVIPWWSIPDEVVVRFSFDVTQSKPITPFHEGKWDEMAGALVPDDLTFGRHIWLRKPELPECIWKCGVFSFLSDADLARISSVSKDFHSWGKKVSKFRSALKKLKADCSVWSGSNKCLWYKVTQKDLKVTIHFYFWKLDPTKKPKFPWFMSSPWDDHYEEPFPGGTLDIYVKHVLLPEVSFLD